jgi:hypothetical protein
MHGDGALWHGLGATANKGRLLAGSYPRESVEVGRRRFAVVTKIDDLPSLQHQ